MVLKAAVPKSKRYFEKVTVHRGTLDIFLHQMIKYQLTHSRSDQISYHKHDTLSYLFKQPIKIVLVYENWTVAFFLSMVSEATVWKYSKHTLPYFKEKVTVQKLVIGF